MTLIVAEAQWRANLCIGLMNIQIYHTFIQNLTLTVKNSLTCVVLIHDKTIISVIHTVY